MDAFMDLRELQDRQIRCAPYPKRWKDFARKYKLTWKAIRFTKSLQQSVPDAPGIYCFLVSHSHPSVPAVGYPLYVGVTGISKNKGAVPRTLRTRFGEYIREKHSQEGRLHVRKFLKVFERELLFMCAPESMSPEAMTEMEKQLNDALMPPYSIKDFTGEVGAQRRAWQ
jgi:hypothetical protein